MATHKSAEKRARQALKRRARNRSVKTQVKSAVKTLETHLSQGNTEAARTALPQVERELRKAASKGVIPAKRASRRVSRLARRVNRTSS